MSGQLCRGTLTLDWILKQGAGWGVEGLVQEAKVKGFTWNGCLRAPWADRTFSSHGTCLARHTGVLSLRCYY